MRRVLAFVFRKPRFTYFDLVALYAALTVGGWLFVPVFVLCMLAGGAVDRMLGGSDNG